MKILDRKTFLTLPAGTVFSKYEPCIFGDLCIKGDNCGDNDFFYQSIVDSVDFIGEFAEFICSMQQSGSEMTMDFESEFRDGCFDDYQLFSVWNREDIEQLVLRLQYLMRWEDYTDPLHDDAQCMALVKKFGLELTRNKLDNYWICSNGGTLDYCSGQNADLNRAIIECVSKIRSEKQ